MKVMTNIFTLNRNLLIKNSDVRLIGNASSTRPHEVLCTFYWIIIGNIIRMVVSKVRLRMLMLSQAKKIKNM